MRPQPAYCSLFSGSTRKSIWHFFDIDTVCGQKFGHPFQIPLGQDRVGHDRHEAVRRLVKQEMSTVVICLLIEHPELGSFVSSRPHSEILARDQIAFDESVHVSHQIADHAEVGSVPSVRQRSKIFQPRLILLVGQLGESFGSFRFDIGEQNQVLRVVPAITGILDCLTGDVGSGIGGPINSLRSDRLRSPLSETVPGTGFDRARIPRPHFHQWAVLPGKLRVCWRCLGRRGAGLLPRFRSLQVTMIARATHSGICGCCCCELMSYLSKFHDDTIVFCRAASNNGRFLPVPS